MGMIREVLPPQGMFCMCIPPIWFAVGVGTIWQCDNCGRIYLRVEGSPAWKKITREEMEEML